MHNIFNNICPYIAIDGIDGSGKSTLTQKLYQTLLSKNNISSKKLLKTKQPGSTPIGSKIRDIFMTEDMSVETQMLLFIADRVEHHQKIINNNYSQKTIICDRSDASTYAYQVHGKEYNPWLYALYTMSLNLYIHPDIYIILNPSDEEVQKAKRNADKDNLEKYYADEMYNNIKKAFLKFAQTHNYNTTIFVIDERDNLTDLILEKIDKNKHNIIKKIKQKRTEMFEQTKTLTVKHGGKE